MKQLFNAHALSRLSKSALETMVHDYNSQLAHAPDDAHLHSQITLIKSALQQKCEP